MCVANRRTTLSNRPRSGRTDRPSSDPRPTLINTFLRGGGTRLSPAGPSPLINTPLQGGGRKGRKCPNRFNGFPLAVELVLEGTVEPVPISRCSAVHAAKAGFGG